MPTPQELQALWNRYDTLMRKGGELTRTEKAELAKLLASLELAGIVSNAVDF